MSISPFLKQVAGDEPLGHLETITNKHPITCVTAYRLLAICTEWAPQQFQMQLTHDHPLQGYPEHMTQHVTKHVMATRNILKPGKKRAVQPWKKTCIMYEYVH